MDKYRKVIKDKVQEEDVKENEEKKLRTVYLKGMGNAISKLVSVAEIIKRRVVGLHQLNELSSIEVVDVYEPLEEGLDRLEQKRLLTCLNITLSLDPLDTTHYGYQPPLDKSEVIPQEQAVEQASERRRMNVERSRGGGTGRRGRRGRENNPKSRGGASQEAEGAASTVAGKESVAIPSSSSSSSMNNEAKGSAGQGQGGRRGRARRGGRGRGRGRETNENSNNASSEQAEATRHEERDSSANPSTSSVEPSGSAGQGRGGRGRRRARGGRGGRRDGREGDGEGRRAASTAAPADGDGRKKTASREIGGDTGGNDRSLDEQ